MDKFRLGVAGYFKVEVVKSNGDVDVRADWFKNLITNAGLDYLGTARTNSPVSAVGVGTSSATPTVTDVSLGAQLNRTTSGRSQVTGANIAEGYGWNRITWTFPEGAVVGNIAELGVFNSTETGGVMFSRSLIKDSAGNPTSITILADESLRITWELRLYWPTEDVVGTFNFTGNIGGSYTMTARALNVGGSSSNNWIPSSPGGMEPVASSRYVYSGMALAPITQSSPTYAQRSIMSSTSLDPYIDGTYIRSIVVTLRITDANFPLGINGFEFNSLRWSCSFQVLIEPAIPKTSNDVVTLRFGISWGRV